MKKMNEQPLDAEESELLDAIESDHIASRKPTPQEEGEYAEAARNTLRKSNRINIRLSDHDLSGIQKRAAELGLPYQSLISGLIHQFVEGELVASEKS